MELNAKYTRLEYRYQNDLLYLAVLCIPYNQLLNPDSALIIHVFINYQFMEKNDGMHEFCFHSLISLSISKYAL